jgi:hypothetical protein
MDASVHTRSRLPAPVGTWTSRRSPNPNRWKAMSFPRGRRTPAGTSRTTDYVCRKRAATSRAGGGEAGGYENGAWQPSVDLEMNTCGHR